MDGASLNSDKTQLVTVCWQPGSAKFHGHDINHWSFDANGEDRLELCNPCRLFGGPDCSMEWLQPRRNTYGLTGRLKSNGLDVNRCQKSVEGIRYDMPDFYL